MRGSMTLDGGLRLQTVHTAPDGTRKLLSTLADGLAADGSVETVMIPVVRRQASLHANCTWVSDGKNLQD